MIPHEALKEMGGTIRAGGTVSHVPSDGERAFRARKRAAGASGLDLVDPQSPRASGRAGRLAARPGAGRVSPATAPAFTMRDHCFHQTAWRLSLVTEFAGCRAAVVAALVVALADG